MTVAAKDRLSNVLVRSVLTAVLAASALGFGPAVGQGEEPAHPPAPSGPALSAETALNAVEFAQFAPIDLSPDGEWVAYTLLDRRRVRVDPEPRYHSFSRSGASIFGLGCDVWITNTETGESRNLTGAHGNSYNPVWSPDGRSLAFFSDRGGKANLWLWDLRTGGLRPLSRRIVRGFGGQIAAWTPDSRQVLFSALPEGMSIEQAAQLFEATAPVEKESKADGSTVTVFDSRDDKDKTPATGSTRAGVADLVLVDVATGASRALTHGLSPSWFQFSPDGSRLAFETRQDYAPGRTFQSLFGLSVMELQDGKVRTLASGIPQESGYEISWAPDGKSLAYLLEGESPEGARGDCYSVDVAGGAPRRLTTGEHPKVSRYFQKPVWDAASQWVYLVGEDSLWKVSASGSAAQTVVRIPNRKVLEVFTSGVRSGRLWSTDGGRSAMLIARDDQTKQLGTFRVDLSSGALTTISDEEKSLGDYENDLYQDVSADGKKIVFLSQDARHPQDLWVAGPDFRDARRLTRINPDFDRYTMGTTRIVEWRTLEGETLRGALLLPGGYQEGKRYPTIVYPYGGSSRSNSLFEFGLSGTGTENMQMFATRGYAVFLPDSRSRPGTPMRDIATSVLAGVAKLVDLGIADPDRLGVMGHSYGGYSTLSIIVQSTIFKAAVARAGIADLPAFYGEMYPDGTALNVQWSEGGQGRMGGTPWDARSTYVENSPWFYLDRVQTPLLIVHGGADTRVPVHNAEEVFVGLRRLGKPVVLARYAGEDHSEMYWSYPNQLDYLRRVVGWFDEYLKASENRKAPEKTAAPSKQE